jgi:hypothetical protein
VVVEGNDLTILHHVAWPRPLPGQPDANESTAQVRCARHRCRAMRTPSPRPPPAQIKIVEHFCFPVDVSTVGAPPGQYTFVRTLDGGDRQFGFCRTSIQPDGYETLCILTRHAWFSVFTPVLEVLEVYRGRGVATLEAILDSAVAATAGERFPGPGEAFAATLQVGKAPYTLRVGYFMYIHAMDTHAHTITVVYSRRRRHL